MNVKNFFSLAVLVFLGYGLWFFLAPQHAADTYGYGAVTTPLSILLTKFFAITMIAGGVMCIVARDAEKSAGRTAVLSFLGVSHLMFLYMNARTMMSGGESSMNYVDLALNVVIGFGALYFITQDRKAA